MVHYPTSWAINIFLLVTCFFAALIYTGFRRKLLTLRGIGWGALLFLLSLLTIPLVLGAIQLVLFQKPPTDQVASALTGDSLLSNGIRWGSAILTLGAFILWYSFILRNNKTGMVDLTLGAYLVLYAAACGSSIAFPELSYLFVWPLLAGSIAAIFWFPTRKGTGVQLNWPQLIGLVAGGVLSIILFVPGILIAFYPLISG